MPLAFLLLGIDETPAGARGGISGEMLDSGTSELGSLAGEKEGGSADKEADFGLPIPGDWTGAEMSGDADGVMDDRDGIMGSELSSLTSGSCNGSKTLLRDAMKGGAAVELVRQSEEAWT